jgi:hypothetical protein
MTFFQTASPDGSSYWIGLSRGGKFREIHKTTGPGKPGLRGSAVDPHLVERGEDAPAVAIILDHASAQGVSDDLENGDGITRVGIRGEGREGGTDVGDFEFAVNQGG